jgi:hypothetical protein
LLTAKIIRRRIEFCDEFLEKRRIGDPACC